VKELICQEFEAGNIVIGDIDGICIVPRNVVGILEALYVHSSAAAASCVWPGDIFGHMIREHDLLKTPLRFESPFVYLPDNIGLGIEPDPDAIAHYHINTKEYNLLL